MSVVFCSENPLTPSDANRKKYTGYERDIESNLDYAQARYYNSSHGRFTSVDPLTASASIKNPQTFNRYSYGLNSPYKFTDPLGLKAATPEEIEKWRWSTFWSAVYGIDGNYDKEGKAQQQTNQQNNQRGNAPDQSNQQRQIPTSLKVVSAVVMDNSVVPDSYKTSTDVNIWIKIVYQVYDQNGKPIRNSKFIPVESVGAGDGSYSTEQGAYGEITAPPEAKENKDDKDTVGGTRSGNPIRTNAKGEFIDSPVGFSGRSNIGAPTKYGKITEYTITKTQTIYIRVGNKDYEVRANTFQTTISKDKTTITNGNDISLCRGTGCPRH
ncbi:MAG TPA: RHS repeat-associated core domain-containing protein [Pyrinomonadaceae bacterium]|nr:RHS repeat-associated core domain-containing protein [Pyrinomonadaceae bacterium]